MFFFILCFLGVDYESEIGLWRYASEIRFFQIYHRKRQLGTRGESGVLRLGGAHGGVNREKESVK